MDTLLTDRKTQHGNCSETERCYGMMSFNRALVEREAQSPWPIQSLASQLRLVMRRSNLTVAFYRSHWAVSLVTVILWI